MPQRTITAAGGNLNATSTWVEGAVPGIGDFIVGDATSGQLTVNQNATIQYMNLSAYTNTLTIQSGVIFTLNASNVTSSVSSGTTFAGTGELRFGAGSSNHSIDFKTTSRPETISSLGGSKTLLNDLYTKNFTLGSNSQSISGSGFKIFCSGSLSSTISATINTGVQIVMDGTGTCNVSTLTGAGSLVFNTTGTTTFVGSFLTCLNGFNVTYSAGTMSSPRLTWTTTAASTLTLNTSGMTWDIFNYNSSTSPLTTTLNFSQQFNVSKFYYPTRSTTSQDILNFSGSSPINITDKLIIQGNINNLDDTTNDELRLVTGVTHSINKIFGYLESNNNFLIRSTTSGQKATLNLGDRLNSPLFYIDFQDINANGGQQITTWNGTSSNSDNILVNNGNIFSTGGGGGSFVYMN